ncbi:MAG: DUF4012 domain-containing protein [Actinobacteria bacterium]|nr:DUF4012 domain-containing protein [Actinomycetota bacterium]
MTLTLDAPPAPEAVSRSRTQPWVLGWTGVSMLLAAFAPTALTGRSGIDLVERVLLAGVVTFVGAHGHRRTWLVTGALAAVAARGVSLALVLIGLAVAVSDARFKRRSRANGAVVSGALVNAVLWYPRGPTTIVSLVAGVLVVVILLASGSGNLRRKPRRILGGVLVALVVLTVVVAAIVGWSGIRARGDVEAGTTAARAALAAVRRGDAEGARTSLATARDALESADRELGTPTAPADVVPGLAQQMSAVRVAIDEALAVTEAADELVQIDYDQLRYDGRLDLQKVGTLQPSSASVLDALDQAQRSLDDVRSGWLLPPLQSRLDEFAGEVADARDDAELADQILAVTPGLLGGQGDRHYLVAFLTPAELRGSGGFIGSFAELEALDGDVNLVRSGRIKELIDAVPPGVRTLSGPDDYVRRWGQFDPQDFLQDVTFPLDWPTAASVLAELYPQSGGRPVDGVIAVDPSGLAALLELTGPVSVPGIREPLSADNAVEFLTKQQYLTYADRASREEVLEAASRATFNRLTNASLPAPRRLGEVLSPAARARHLQIWSPDEEEEALFRTVHADGSVSVPKGTDALAVVQQNSANNKIDAYLQRTVTYDADVDVATGHVEATATITLTNAVPTLDLPRPVVGNTKDRPDGTSISLVTIMTPFRVTSATLDGFPVDLAADRESGLNTWQLSDVAVGKGDTVTLVVKLSGGVDLRKGYQFRYLPQPMANPDILKATATAKNGRFDVDGRDRSQVEVEAAAAETVAIDEAVRR